MRPAHRRGILRPYIAPKEQAAPQFASGGRCRGITRSGQPCTNTVLGPSLYCCRAHRINAEKLERSDRANGTCLGTTAWRERCRRPANGSGYCKLHQDQFRMSQCAAGPSAEALRLALAQPIVPADPTRLRPVSYEDYLRSRHWAAVKKAVRYAYNGRCQICRSQNDTHVHHRSYDRLGHERWGDVALLCSSCHRTFHEGYRSSNGHD